MKKYLFIALAAFAFAACEKPADDNNAQQNGELEQSYVAVSLLADDMSTRATGDRYEDGDPAERKVKSLYFFLFDAEGNPFNIDSGVNYKQVDVNETGNASDETPNVSDVKNRVFVFKNYVGKYPSQIVAVINWAPAPGTASFTLDALAGQLLELKTADDAFVMSNAVYAAESTNASAQKEAVRATPLTPANIAKKEIEIEQGLVQPVKIYVERIAAKVTVNTTTENKYDIQETVDGKQIYAQVLGWELYNEYDKSYLLKKINPAWTTTEVGFNWNDAAWFRSYWAISQTTAFDAATNQVSYNTLSNDVADSDYCGENTYNDACTKVVVKAQLVEEVNGTLQPIEIATWFGNDYINEAALRTVVANTLASQLYYLEGTDYKSIEPNHLKVVEANETNPNTQAQAELKAYHVFFQLSNDGVAKEWYTYSSVEGFKVAADDAVNVILGGVEPALLYRGGQTYYYTNIKHLPSTVDATQYGVVRNHVYKVNINNIKGFGTPVYDGNTYFDPETPEDIETFISAEVRILSWRVVENGYNLGE
ncbi:MAG: Mfa1 fimbrilin C-terminal domain-containing protein [Alistipes sp.]|nr:Mfa1 fimbrilin C-terminal domain-containing protein [Alistipes sp.]